MLRPPARSVATLVLALSCAGACAAQVEETAVLCAQSLEAKLKKLVDLPESLWRFVVLQAPEGEHFIQFAWWGGVVVDLPTVALDVEQQARAGRVFDQVGAGTPVPLRGPDGATMDDLQTFQHDFGRDTAAAAQFGCDALRSIYPVADDVQLEVIMGGD